MNTQGERLTYGMMTTVDNDNVCVFQGVVSPCATYWVFRFKDGPARGDHGPYPQDPPEQFDVAQNELGQWVMTPCDGRLALARHGLAFRYARESMSSLSDSEAEGRKVIRGAVYGVIG